MGEKFVNAISTFFTNGGFIILIMVAMLLIMIIPQRKREKKVKDMLASIKPGDRVRTIGGIYGTVTSVKDDVVTMSVGPIRFASYSQGEPLRALRIPPLRTL